MEKPVIIDKKTYKLMRFMYGKGAVPYPVLEDKFGDDDVLRLIELCRENYATHIVGKTYTNDASVISNESKFALLVPGNKIVEDIQEAKLIRRLPIFLSAVSVLTSVVALILSLVNSDSTLFVHIL